MREKELKMTNEEWMKEIAMRSAVKIKKSAAFVSIVSKEYLQSGKAAIELGLSIFYDKPIILTVIKGTKIPKKLEQVADKVFYVDGPDDVGMVFDEIEPFLDSLPKDE